MLTDHWLLNFQLCPNPYYYCFLLQADHYLQVKKMTKPFFLDKLSQSKHYDNVNWVAFGKEIPTVS